MKDQKRKKGNIENESKEIKDIKEVIHHKDGKHLKKDINIMIKIHIVKVIQIHLKERNKV